MPRHVVLVHGYSVRALGAYGLLPELLGKTIKTSEIYLSGYDSLNDDITTNDLALALEVRVRQLVDSYGLDLRETAFIAHSFGALVVRRWILNRWNQQQLLPTHFISLAGAHHGSSLAQLGESALAYLFRAVDGGTKVGMEVLQDLDYGSDFLLQLSDEWLDAFLSMAPPAVRCFSLIGDNHQALQNQIFWQTRENGSDSTVRICGGNLNYSVLSIDQNSPHPTLSVKQLGFDVPHLVLHGPSHVNTLGADTGILGGNEATMALVFPAITEALAVSTDEEYAQLASSWRARTDLWSNDKNNVSQCNSTIVFTLRHPGGRHVEDALILIRDESADNTDKLSTPDDAIPLLNVGASIEPPHPIQNNVTPSSFAFYVNYARFIATYPHRVEITIRSGTPEIQYPPVRFRVDRNSAATLRANEFVYVKVTLARQSQGTYTVLPVSFGADRKTTWPPLPEWPPVTKQPIA